MMKKYSWKKSLFKNIFLLFLLVGIIILIVVISYLWGELIKSNELFCSLVGTFLGIFAALMFDRLIENFKSIKTLKNWLILLDKELTPILQIQPNSSIQFNCLQNLINSPDFTLFMKNEELLLSLYNLNNNLEKFENGQNDSNIINAIKKDIKVVINFIK